MQEKLLQQTFISNFQTVNEGKHRIAKSLQFKCVHVFSLKTDFFSHDKQNLYCIIITRNNSADKANVKFCFIIWGIISTLYKKTISSQFRFAYLVYELTSNTQWKRKYPLFYSPCG